MLSFFCSCSGDPRNLHSFPTRRSSDLGRRDVDLVIVFFAGVVLVVVADLAGGDALRVRVELGPRRDRDRKSTRLNSSHSQISYAVFCLKKKRNDSSSAASVCARLGTVP